MRQNNPETLDEALTRPGRIDLTIKFDLANKQQMKDLFLRMYCVDSIELTRQPTKISQILPVQDGREALDLRALTDANDTDYENGTLGAVSTTSSLPARMTYLETDVNRDQDMEIVELAEQFADALPEQSFSPAEIQGYLLVRKLNPAQAVKNVTGWRDEQLMKKSGKKSTYGNEVAHGTNEIETSAGKVMVR